MNFWWDMNLIPNLTIRFIHGKALTVELIIKKLTRTLKLYILCYTELRILRFDYFWLAHDYIFTLGNIWFKIYNFLFLFLFFDSNII